MINSRIRFIFLFFLLQSCQKSAVPTKTIGESGTKGEITIDTFYKISDQVYTIYDFNFDRIYGVSKDRSKVIVYDVQLAKEKTFHLAGEGPDKTGDIHIVYAFDEDKFVVHDIRSAYLYNAANEKFSFSCSNLFTDINVGTLSAGFRKANYKVILPAISPRIPQDDEKYYKNPDVFFFTDLDLKTCKVNPFFVSVDEKSVYHEYYFPIRQRGLIEPLGDDKVLLYFQFDKIVQIVDLNSQEVIDRIALKPNFRELQSAKDRSLQEMARIAQLNPAYIRMKVTKDSKYLITQYIKGQSTYAGTMDFLDGRYERQKRWIEIYDLENHVKIFETDLAISENEFFLIEATTKNAFYFYTNSHEGEEGTFLFKCSYR